MSQKTPAVIYGLKEGPYTVRLSLGNTDPFIREKSDIQFEDQEVYVYPYWIVLVDVAANTSRSEEIIVDSRSMRGENRLPLMAGETQKLSLQNNRTRL